MRHEDFKAKMLKNPRFAKSYKTNKNRLAFKIAMMLIRARKIKGFTQQELAKALGTGQSSVARVESGTALPSLSFLKKIADVYETDLIPPRFEFMETVINRQNEVNQDFQSKWMTSGQPAIVWNIGSRAFDNCVKVTA